MPTSKNRLDKHAETPIEKVELVSGSSYVAHELKEDNSMCRHQLDAYAFDMLEKR